MNGRSRPVAVVQLTSAVWRGRCSRTSGDASRASCSSPARSWSEYSDISSADAARASVGRRGREQHAVGEQRVELLAQLGLPLRVGLPAGDRLQARRPLQRERLRERAR